MDRHLGTRARRYARRAAQVGAGAGAAAIVLAPAPSVDARELLSGQCGVDEYTWSYGISSDGALSFNYAGSGKSRVARFRFFGVDYGPFGWSWDSYQYRYAVTATNFGPQSNEVVRFGQKRDSPDDSFLSEYASPDSHNSNFDGSAPVQTLGVQPGGAPYVTPAGNTEIWTKAIFDMPSGPDPSCWTNAVSK